MRRSSGVSAWTMRNRAGLILLIIAISRCSAQWSAGLGLGAPYLPPVQPRSSIHGARELDHRSTITAVIASNLPHWAQRSGFHPAEPRQLATGDTGAYSFEVATRQTTASALVGVRGIVGPLRHARHWYWAISVGYGLEHKRYKGTHSYSYPDRQLIYDDKINQHYMVGALGLGSQWRLKQIDLLAGVAYSRWFPLLTGANEIRGVRGRFEPAVQVAALWRWSPEWPLATYITLLKALSGRQAGTGIPFLASRLTALLDPIEINQKEVRAAARYNGKFQDRRRAPPER